MKIDKIQFRSGMRMHKGLQPEKVYEELQKAERKNGGELTADAVVSHATNKRCHIHKHFEWDDTKAAHEHRLYQARTLIRSIEVVPAERPDQPTRAFEVLSKAATPDKPSRKVYETIEEIIADPQKRQQVIDRALSELLTIRAKYRSLNELSVVFRIIDKTAEELVS